MSVIFSIGIAFTTVAAAYMLVYMYKNNRNKWKVNVSMNPFVVAQRDNFTKWVDMLDQRLNKNGLKIRGINIVLISMIISLAAFFMGLDIFKNFSASVFLAATFFVVPEYVLFLYENKRRMKIEDLMITAIKLFTAEYIKTKNIEKSFAEVSTKVLEPVGGYFGDAYIDLIMGHSINSVLAKLSSRIDNEYWHMFIQLIYQLNDDSKAIHLFTDLVTRIEKNINLTRSNEVSLGAERLQALLLSIAPVPVYFYMVSIVPETETFIVDSVNGRIFITISFLSIFLFIFLDKMLRRVE